MSREIKGLILLLFKHLFALCQKAFIQSTQEDTSGIADFSKEVANACSQATNDELKVANCKLQLLKAFEQQGLVEKM